MHGTWHHRSCDMAHDHNERGLISRSCSIHEDRHNTTSCTIWQATYIFLNSACSWGKPVLSSYWGTSKIKVVISDLQISPLFPWNISKWNINVRVSKGGSLRALSYGACNTIIEKTLRSHTHLNFLHRVMQTKTKLVVTPRDRFSWLRSQ